MARAPGTIEKIVVNSGIGRLATVPGFEDKVLPELVREFAAITGQKPALRTARKSISGFKLREGSVVGLTVTLRGKRMHGFLDRVNAAVFPRIRDFRGVSLEHIDANGNLNIGIREQLVFPEIVPETSKVSFGIQISVVPKRVKDREEAIAMYRKLGVPLQKSSH